MDSAGYKIILSLSHHRISFEYWQRDAETVLRPLPPGNWPAQLAFYASPSGIKIGDEAARAAHAGITNAFDNYFERSVEDDTYTIAGQCRPLRYILLDAAESVFGDFYRTVLINRLGLLDDNRASMPLTIVCEADIKPNERSFLKGLFSDSGYAKVNVENYEILIGRYIKDYLSKDFEFENVVVAWTEGEDLAFTLYNVKDETPVAGVILSGLGVDPRKEYVGNIIWERVVSQNPWLSRTVENERIEKVATDFLNSSLPLVTGHITLSDGFEYAYSLNRREIDFIPHTEGIRIKEKLSDFLLTHGITDRRKTILLLRGVAAGNPYFENNLSSGFLRTIKSDQKLRNNTMRQLIAMKGKESGVKEVIGKGSEQQKTVSPPISSPEEAPKQDKLEMNDKKDNSQEAKELKKRWREIKAAAKGKERAGNSEEALRILDGFYGVISSQSAFGDLRSEVIALKNEITSKLSSSIPPQKSNCLKERPKRERKPDIMMTEGDKLINQGKFKEARDWFRSEGNSTKARILADIVRARKGVEIRKNTIEECRKTKDHQQITRIIRELEDYINDCEKVNAPVGDIKLLMKEYKKIIMLN